jgi:predicted TIM-barrel fold metal-dependent hydrolase
MNSATHRFGRIAPPDGKWLARQEVEPVLDPDLPIIDTHHHLWVRGGHTYLLADLDTGHNAVAALFEECRSMYRASADEKSAAFSGTARRIYRLA